MAAWYIVLGDFENADDANQEHQDREAVPGIAKTKDRRSECKGSKSLQADGSGRSCTRTIIPVPWNSPRPCPVAMARRPG
jgi:hypothetical protein